MTSLNDIHGLGKLQSRRLYKTVGIRTQEVLLKQCANKPKRLTIAKKTGIKERVLFKWCSLADLARVKGIGAMYADCLTSIGITNVPQLAKANPKTLHNKLMEFNKRRKFVKVVPSIKMCSKWIRYAKRLRGPILH